MSFWIDEYQYKLSYGGLSWLGRELLRAIIQEGFRADPDRRVWKDGRGSERQQDELARFRSSVFRRAALGTSRRRAAY